MLGRARLNRRPQRAERINIFVKLLFRLPGDFPYCLVQRQAGKIPGGAVVDLVVDVGDVADIGDVVGTVEMPQQAEQYVEYDDWARIADMSEVIDRRPADIHADVLGI